MAQTGEIGTHATTTSQDAGTYVVTYHRTHVVMWDSEEIRLNTEGWHTTTTKLRMNQASNQFNLGYHVYQKDYHWFVGFNSQVLPFEDGMILKR